MSIAAFIVVYIIAWWLVFFIVLPIGVRRNEAPEQGHDAGAPVRHMIGKKALWSTVGAAIFLLAYWLAVDVFQIRIL